jgi:hypothetical protein
MIPFSRIVIHRHLAAWQDTLRSYRILVDGHPVARVTNGQTVAVDVVPGVHHVQARINWSGSPIIRVEAPTGSEIHLDLRPAGTPLDSCWRMFTRDKWLVLRVHESPFSINRQSFDR